MWIMRKEGKLTNNEPDRTWHSLQIKLTIIFLVSRQMSQSQHECCLGRLHQIWNVKATKTIQIEPHCIAIKTQKEARFLISEGSSYALHWGNPQGPSSQTVFWTLHKQQKSPEKVYDQQNHCCKHFSVLKSQSLIQNQQKTTLEHVHLHPLAMREGAIALYEINLDLLLHEYFLWNLAWDKLLKNILKIKWSTTVWQMYNSLRCQVQGKNENSSLTLNSPVLP